MQNDQPSEEVVDEASEESFPASDPPAHSSPAEDVGGQTPEPEKEGEEAEADRPPSDS